MTPSSLPLGATVANVDPVVALFGRFDLHDAELRAVRLSLGANGTAQLEADLILPGEFALGGAGADRGADYVVTLRCSDVTDVALADFIDQNTVAEYAFEPIDAEDGRTIRCAVTCSPGCDIELRCRAVAVVGVQAIAI